MQRRLRMRRWKASMERFCPHRRMMMVGVKLIMMTLAHARTPVNLAVCLVHPMARHLESRRIRSVEALDPELSIVPCKHHRVGGPCCGTVCHLRRSSSPQLQAQHLSHCPQLPAQLLSHCSQLGPQLPKVEAKARLLLPNPKRSRRRTSLQVLSVAVHAWKHCPNQASKTKGTSAKMMILLAKACSVCCARSGARITRRG